MPPQEKFESQVPECVAENKETCPNLVGNVTTTTTTTTTTQETIPQLTVTASDTKNGEGTNKDMDFDDLLPYVGEFGLYQKILFILMIPFAFFVAWVYFSQIFITLIPEEHWCRVPELANLTVDQRIALAIPLASAVGSGEESFTSYSRCAVYAVNFTELLEQGVQVADPSWPIEKCQHGWEFNFTEIPYPSIAVELEWVCDNAALPSLAQSIFFVGAIFGGLIFGWIADRYGRIPALVGTNMAGFVAGIATVFTTSFWQFSLCRFLVGLAFDNCFTMMYILVLEYVGPKWRTFVANMSIALFFTAASCLLPWIAYFLADWRLTCIVTSTPLVLALATPWLVPESARWLVSQGKVDRAISILRKFERINGKTVPENVYQDFKETCAKLQKEEESDKTYSVLDLFSTPRLRNITILLIIIWMAISLVFDGHVRNVGSLGLNVFMTFTVASATELPADTFLTAVLDRWGRRWLAFGSMFLSGIFSLWAAAVPTGLYSASLAIMGRFCVNISYNIGLQYAAELLPTVVRAQGVALIHIMGYVASIVAPFIVYMAVISPVLPLLVLGVVAIVGGGLALFLPETLDKELPLTLQDGEDFGKDQGMWDMPCLAKKHDDEESPPPLTRSFARGSVRGSMRASLRGETLRSSMIRRSSVRSRRGPAAAITEEMKGNQINATHCQYVPPLADAIAASKV
ncbi:organic cation transporter protein-like [Athalia rosae]|uniref:organic cation transporter protein-like n=1 Tax=Athalia rosae TaxID=37344 RepID=UPI00203496A5|nr:organic cation transporter protein-like [Athalia rosae]